MKKLKISRFCICAAVVLMVCCICCSTVFGTTVEPMADNYVGASTSISISGSTVKATASITGVLGRTTKTTIHLYLQQYKDGSWLSISDWISAGETQSRTLTKTKTVTKGYKYRTKAICSAYAGTDKESVTKYSSTIS